MTDGTVADTTVAKANGLDMKFKMSAMGYTFDCRAVVVHNINTMYLLLFMTRGDPTDAQARVQKVLESVEFTK
jgi:hypothetical protein